MTPCRGREGPQESLRKSGPGRQRGGVGRCGAGSGGRGNWQEIRSGK